MIQFIFIFIFFIPTLAYAQDPYTPQVIHNEDVLFFSDNIISNIPNDIVTQLNNVPTQEFDDGIIYYLMQTGQYKNITVKKLQNKQSKKNFYLVTASYVKKIQAIIFEGIKSNEQVSYQKNLTQQVGKIYREYLIEDDMKRIERNIRQKGYPNASVKSFRLKQDVSNFVTLIYTIEKGPPCRIEQIIVENSNANILNFLNLPIETGSICDVPSINDKLYEIKTNYWRQGYLTAEAKIKDFVYSPSKERAELNLIIEKGPKTILQIQDENKNFLNLDFLNSKQTAISYSDLLFSSDQDINNLLVNYYQNLGYPYVTVSGPDKTIDANKNNIISFIVKRGNFVKIGKIFFEGDMPLEKIVAISEMQLGSGVFSADIPFVQSNLRIYRDKLKNLLLKDGYADAKVQIPDYGLSSDGTQADLIFNVKANDKYILNDIKINNLPKGLELKSKKLNLILSSGNAVNYENKQAYVSEIRNQLLDKGYLYTQLKLDQSVKDSEPGIKLVTLNLSIDAGPVVRIGKITAQGDLFNKEKEIISISELEEGEIFTQRVLDAARGYIIRHNLFSSVIVEPMDPTALERKEVTLDIVIRTREKSGFVLTLSPGWGTLRGYRFGIDYSLYKITEDGLNLTSSAGVSQEKQQSNFASNNTRQILGEQLNIGLTEPLFKLGPIYTPLNISTVAGYQVVAETLTNREYLTLKLSSEWKPQFFGFNWIYTTSFIHEKSISTSSESAVVQSIDSPSLVIRELVNSLSLDTRDNNAWPTMGGFFSFDFALARFDFGSNVQYNRYQPKANIYFPIYKKLSGAFLMGGAFITDVTNQNGETITPPASRRATLTDEASIRGFPETYGAAAPGSLLWIHYATTPGASNCNTELASVGGTNLVYFKGETRYRVNDIFGLVAFMDSGESYFKKSEVDGVNAQISKLIKPSTSTNSGQCVVDSAKLIAPNSNNLAYSDFIEQYWNQAYVSTGIGLRFILGNIASISLDYGYPLKDPDDNCGSTSDALNSKEPPQCISRIQPSSYDLKYFKIKFKGAIHLGIGAQF